MNLKIITPLQVVLDQDVDKVRAEAQNGAFTLLERHIDFVAALEPGLLSYEDDDNEEVFYAVNGGILVKSGDQVMVSTRNAIRGPDLGELKRVVAEEFMVLDERQKAVRSAMAKIEASFARRFLEIRRYE